MPVGDVDSVNSNGNTTNIETILQYVVICLISFAIIVIAIGEIDHYCIRRNDLFKLGSIVSYVVSVIDFVNDLFGCATKNDIMIANLSSSQQHVKKTINTLKYTQLVGIA